MIEPEWLEEVLGVLLPSEGEAVTIRGVEMVRRGGILRARRGTDAGEQAQTARAFAYKWRRRETFESEAMLERRRRWLRERYGEVADASWWCGLDSTALLDAGCGAGSSAIGLFGDRLRHVRYLGVDVSDAVDVPRARFAERSLGGGFLQADLTELPLPEESVAVILSEGVLHHTPSTRQSLHRLASLLAPGGRLLFYVYARKGPIREFTDDFIRREISCMTPAEAWETLLPLAKLGIALVDLDVEIDVPEDIGILGLPKVGRRSSGSSTGMCSSASTALS